MSVSVHVCVRERERKRGKETEIDTQHAMIFFKNINFLDLGRKI